MKEKTVSQLAKLMADEKIIAILKATKNKKGLTSKEISKKTNIPANKLYYSIKKMLDQGLLEISQKQNINNFQEFYYSSYKMTHQNPKTFPSLESDSERGISISISWIKEHNKEIVKMIIYETQQFLEALQSDVQKYGSGKETAEGIRTVASKSSLKLSETAEKKLMKDIFLLLTEAEKNDKEKDKRTVNLLLEKW
ncbi:putative transcriptional regulator [Oenococcus oeni]|uniref:winged helix-turn-helix domain-containing protein n=1 Tax=Oenococcus oeni TaxID=1247 RepID=UPI00107760C1|nr:helix-turn-helix domain-containing protein [Oenococcus oeni]AVI93889.1 ArsR family transcriptional regulator [Oenococcus oeni]SYW02274.1 putative transcriptional regulator [Oenococcus oeni]SYW03110.1 putative transcriptional regulator [Oenococcus oeni]SYW04179.1 putative transcriptional regulator [Oenococcus oeni]SYW18694.1 putative transcriptional regulator [Oenococcus oeni]